MKARIVTSESGDTPPAVSREEFERLKAQNTDLIAQNAELEQKLTWLMEQMRIAKRQEYGASSEHCDYGQMNLFNEAEALADENAAEPALEENVKGYTRKQRERTMDTLPDNLPVETVEHTLPPEDQNCPKCGNALHVMGQDIREEIKIVPAKVVLVRHIRYTYACRDCAKNDVQVPIIKAPITNPVIKGSFASPEAVAHIAAQKYVMGIPLYRQEQEWKRAGVTLSRQTMSNWLVKTSTDWLEPVWKALRQLLLERGILHADESFLQVLRENGKAATSDSRMWLYRTSGDAEMAIVLFEYQPDRTAKRAETFLEGFKGYLHTDGYGGYHGLPEDIVVVGCWAHARRYFEKALKILPKQKQAGSGALHGVQVCDTLFSIERTLKNLAPEERFKKRNKQAKPILDDFYDWLSQQEVGKSAFGKAVKYALGQWKYLERYLLDGRLEISNNRAENSIRPFTVGRKNWLFANTPKGAKSSAILYSIVETAKENGLDPYRYLVYLYKTAPNCDLDDPKAVEMLLPNNAPKDCLCPIKQTVLDGFENL